MSVIPDFAIEPRLVESSRNPRTFATPIRAIWGAQAAGFQLEPHDGETLHGLASVGRLEHEAVEAAFEGGRTVAFADTVNVVATTLSARKATPARIQEGLTGNPSAVRRRI